MNGPYACEDTSEITKRIKELREEAKIPTCTCPRDNEGRKVGLSSQCKVHGDG